jgi:hypothetical protein
MVANLCHAGFSPAGELADSVVEKHCSNSIFQKKLKHLLSGLV